MEEIGRWPSRVGGRPFSDSKGQVERSTLLKEVSQILRSTGLSQDEVGTILAELPGPLAIANAQSYSILLNLFRKRRWNQVIYLWQCMQHNGIKTNSQTSGLAAESFLRSRSWHASLVVINNMRDKRLPLKKEAMGALLSINARRRLWQEALDQFIKDGPHHRSQKNRLFQALADVGQVSGMRRLKSFLSELHRR
ncbi:unnamed protein product [Effrenium voratum]|uniref:Uncharacterized protein n=1 Tax=Effrenium voratum TaxID=2562239 RepID=A0AA36IRK3_9DINO|nr:unnamed protein product [Effrenium voratum]